MATLNIRDDYVPNPGTVQTLSGRAEPVAGGGGGGTLTAPDDQEILYMQDDNGGVITQFMRVRIVDDAGGVVVVDRELDGTTAYTPTGTVSFVSGGGDVDIAPIAADLKDTLVLTKEYAGASTVNRSAVLTDLGAAALVEIDILVRQVDDPANDSVPVTFGGETVNLPLGGSTTFTAQPGRRLGDFTITLTADQAINVTAQGVN